MVEGGLRQVAVHIDMTQAGRHGWPINRIKSEADLHPVRDVFTKLGLDLRAKTGLTLEFAHNCTVTGTQRRVRAGDRALGLGETRTHPPVAAVFLSARG